MQSPTRLRLWAYYAVFTLILIIAIAQVETAADANMDDEHGATDKGWGLALSIITLITIAFVQYSHTNPTLQTMIIGQKYEGIIILVLLLFSTVLVGIVSGPNRGLAVDKDGAVNVGNMYYSCWAGFINCFAILSSYIESSYGINVAQTMKARSSSFTYWTAFLLSSLIVMGTASDIYNRNCDVPNDDKQQPYCGRSVLAVTIGTIGVLLSLIVVIMKISMGGSPFLMEVGFVFFLAILYVFEVAYVTAASGPGSPLGNLYYFSWMSFFLTLLVSKACHEDYVEAQIIVEQQQNPVERPMPTLENVHEDGVNPGSPVSRNNMDNVAIDDDVI